MIHTRTQDDASTHNVPDIKVEEPEMRGKTTSRKRDMARHHLPTTKTRQGKPVIKTGPGTSQNYVKTETKKTSLCPKVGTGTSEKKARSAEKNKTKPAKGQKKGG